jgi:peptidoglycan/LPS O-acetylase OafA/YrhL
MPVDIKPLTALRFLAAMWVVSFHYWPHLAGFGVPTFVSKGYLGVECFFVLSGFILAHVYLDGLGKGGFNYAKFLWARLARVYPLHLATLAGVGVLAFVAARAGIAMDHEIAPLKLLPANLLLVHAWGVTDSTAWNHPSWSISAEWFAYLSFPVFGWVAWRLRERPGVAVALALALLMALYTGFQTVVGFPLTKATFAWGALRIVPCFAYGVALNLLWRKNRIETSAMAKLGVLLFAVLIAWLGLMGGPDLGLTAAFGGLILCLASLTSTGSNLFSSKLGVYLGEVSYAVYMVCFPWELVAMNGARKLLGVQDALPLPVWLAIVAGVIPVAMLAHHLVERPARNAMRRWAEMGWRRNTPAAEAI